MGRYDTSIIGMTCCHKGRIGDGHFCYHELMFQIAKANSDYDRRGKMTLVVNNKLTRQGVQE